MQLPLTQYPQATPRVNNQKHFRNTLGMRKCPASRSFATQCLWLSLVSLVIQKRQAGVIGLLWRFGFWFQCNCFHFHSCYCDRNHFQVVFYFWLCLWAVWFFFLLLLQVAGIKGMFLANKKTDKQVKTHITYNRGRDWRLLQAPNKDLRGNSIHCMPVSLCIYVSVYPFSFTVSPNKVHCGLVTSPSQSIDKQSFTSKCMHIESCQ